MTVSVHQVNALLNRLIQQELRPGMRAGDAEASAGGHQGDRVNISDAARTASRKDVRNLDEHLLALYTQAARKRS